MFHTAGSRIGRKRPGKSRIVLTGTTKFYVDSATGSDAGLGTIGSPWKTRLHAWNWVQQNIDMAQQVVICYLNGTFSAPEVFQGQFVGDAGGRFNFIGLGNNAANALCQSTGGSGVVNMTFQDNALVSLQYLTIGSSGTNGQGIGNQSGCTVNLYNCIFSACGFLAVHNTGWLLHQTATTISGDMAYYLNNEANGIVSMTQQFIASGGTRNFSSAFLNNDECGFVETTGMPAPSGTFTGVRAIVSTNAILNVDSATSLPGNSGILNKGGQVVVNSQIDPTPRLCAGLTANQSVTSATWTKANLTALVDSHSWFASGVYTPLASGTYYYSFQMTATGTTLIAGNQAIAELSKNGTIGGTGVGQAAAISYGAGSDADMPTVAGSGLVAMNGTTDTLELDVNITATAPNILGNASPAFFTSLTVFRIGP